MTWTGFPSLGKVKQWMHAKEILCLALTLACVRCVLFVSGSIMFSDVRDRMAW